MIVNGVEYQDNEFGLEMALYDRLSPAQRRILQECTNGPFLLDAYTAIKGAGFRGDMIVRQAGDKAVIECYRTPYYFNLQSGIRVSPGAIENT